MLATIYHRYIIEGMPQTTNNTSAPHSQQVDQKTNLLKFSILGMIIFIESFLLTRLIADFVQNQNVFNVPLLFSIKITALMLLTIITFALTLGGWRKWEQYVFIPIPVSVEVLLGTITFRNIYPVFMSLVFLLALGYDVFLSNRLKHLLLKPHPKMIMRFSTRGMLFLFSILGGVLFILSANNINQLDIGKELGRILDQPIREIVREPTIGNVPLTSGIINVKDIAENQLNELIEPYKHFVNPVMAILTFALFQFYASIAYLIYMLTIDWIYELAKKVKFMKVETLEVVQEQLTF